MAKSGTASYVGRRVRWTGPPDPNGVSPAYRDAVATGRIRRAPTPQERRTLERDDEGTVIKLLRPNTDIGDVFLLRFGGDDGYESEVPLPSPGLVTFLDQNDEPDVDHYEDRQHPATERPAPQRYADYSTRRHRWRGLLASLRLGRS